jgi:antirestriction protein ArdC
MTTMDVYAIATEKIINLLEQGIVPWRRPWISTGLPRNLESKKPYRGVNHFLLSAAMYVSPFWLTMRQANEHSGHVRKGEESTIVVFWKVDNARQTTEGSNNEQPKREPPAISIALLPRFQSGTVRAPARRAGQTSEDRDARARSDRSSRPDSRRNAESARDRAPRNEGVLQHHRRPHYELPRNLFVSAEEYGSTVLHELTHYADSRIMPRNLPGTLA